MKEIVLCNVYLLGEKGWSDGWIGAICPGGKCNGGWACPVWEYWEARPWPGRECIIGEIWLGKSTSPFTLWPESSLGSISSAALSSSVDAPAREAFGRGARAPFRITSWTPSPDMPLTLHYVLSIQFFNGKLKRKPMNSDAEEKDAHVCSSIKRAIGSYSLAAYCTCDW